MIFTAKEIAERLLAEGIPVLASSEGDDVVDGEVQINEVLSVQVPTFGGNPGLTEWVDGGRAMKFHPCCEPELLAEQIRRLI